MSTHPEYDADSMLLTLEILDTNTLPTDDDGKGSLNADYGQRMKIFLETYRSTVDKSKGYNKFNLEDELGDCAKPPYGYISEELKNGTITAIKPCVFLVMNDIWSWKPEPISAEDFQTHKDWPKSLESHFNSLSEHQRQQVFVDCQGDTSSDQEAMKHVSYFLKAKGISVKYFPYQGEKEKYQPPLVALQFDGGNLKNFVEMIITVKCNAYYKGGSSQGGFRIRFQHKNFR